MAVAFSNSLVGILSAVVLTVARRHLQRHRSSHGFHAPDRNVPRPSAAGPPRSATTPASSPASASRWPGSRAPSSDSSPRCGASRRHQGSSRSPPGRRAQARRRTLGRDPCETVVVFCRTTRGRARSGLRSPTSCRRLRSSSSCSCCSRMCETWSAASASRRFSARSTPPRSSCESCTRSSKREGRARRLPADSASSRP